MSTPPALVPKDRFSSLDTLALVRELRSIGTARIDKAFDVTDGGVSLSLRRPGKEREELLIVPGQYAALVPGGLTHADELGHVTRELRRWLSGAVIHEVRQPGGERYFEVEFRRGDVPLPLLLVVELFGTGNLVVARGTKLVLVQTPKTWAHRTVRVGAEYARPPSRRDPWVATVAELEAVLTMSRTDRASTLAARLALGGPVAEELLARAELPGHVPAPMQAGEAAERLHRAIGELTSEIGDHPKGYLYRRGEMLIDVEPFVARRWRDEPDVQREELARFSEAAHTYFRSVGGLLAETSATRHDPAAEVARQRERQVNAIVSLTDEAQRLLAEAERIFAHYTEAQELLAKAATESSSSDRIEITLEGAPTHLWQGKSPRESAQLIYEEAKKIQAKLAGAEAALKETDRHLEEIETGHARPVIHSGSVAVPKPRKPHWFERYRWFFSSEGVLVIGGRDAQSNDLIVRRYLKSNDLYIHAEIHGAPSVVVKHPPPGSPAPGASTLNEAGQWGVAYSKAWRVGLASADAFWVAADQVSKKGASGEFVARGAWVIHGTKHFLKDLPTELALGLAQVEGDQLWMVAPPAALRSRGEVRFLLTPGDERDRLSREKELAEVLGIPRDLLQSLLPAGGLTLRRP